MPLLTKSGRCLEWFKSTLPPLSWFDYSISPDSWQCSLNDFLPLINDFSTSRIIWKNDLKHLSWVDFIPVNRRVTLQEESRVIIKVFDEILMKMPDCSVTWSWRSLVYTHTNTKQNTHTPTHTHNKHTHRYRQTDTHTNPEVALSWTVSGWRTHHASLQISWKLFGGKKKKPTQNSNRYCNIMKELNEMKKMK